jgi:hypothetical protein
VDWIEQTPRPGRCASRPGHGCARNVTSSEFGACAAASRWRRNKASGSARVVCLDDVYAAGDLTNFPFKQGGIASQLADTAIVGIAAALGAGVKPARFSPVLRGMLLHRVSRTHLRAAIGGDAGEPGQLASTPLWWPATMIAGRYLGLDLARTGSPQSAERLQAPTGAHDDPREVLASHSEARELALSFALADASSEDYPRRCGGWRWWSSSTGGVRPVTTPGASSGGPSDQSRP